MTHRAIVVSTGKNSAWIAVDGENLPRLARLRRTNGRRSMPVPGDVAHVRILPEDEALVERIEPRTATLQRRITSGRTKTMAANVDMLVTVTSLADPPPRLPTLDQLLAFAEFEGLTAAIVFTKPDLAGTDRCEALCCIYRALGYPIAVINPKNGENVDALRELIRDRRAMLAGNSGVGKSTIFRALGGESVVGEVSRHGLGRQTTTSARLYRLGAGFLIDSPGISEFGLGKLGPQELVQGFREMRAPALRCRFADCRHASEPGCAVLAEAAEGRIAESRLRSYRAMLQPS